MGALNKAELIAGGFNGVLADQGMAARLLKLKRAASRGAASNPVTSPLTTEGTVTEAAAAPAATTRKYTPAQLLPVVAVTGGTPILSSDSAMIGFPSVNVAPSLTGGSLTSGSSFPLNLDGFSSEITTNTNDSTVVFELNVPSTTRGWRVAVDGQYIGSREPTAFTAAGRRFLIIDFGGVRRPRDIRLEVMTSRLFVYAMYTRPTANLRRPMQLDPIIHMAAGDSYAEGVGANFNGVQSYQKYLGLRLFGTAVDTRIVARGSTGYVSANFATGAMTTTSGSTTVNLTSYPAGRSLAIGQFITGAGIPAGAVITDVGSYAFGNTSATIVISAAATASGSGVAYQTQARYPLADQIAGWFTVNTDLDPAKVDIITLMEGFNDTSFPPAQVNAAAALAFTRMRATCPNAYIFVFGVAPGISNNSGSTQAIENAVRDAVASVNDPKLVFMPVSTAVPPPMFGTGDLGNQNGSGNTDFLMSSDKVHPSAEGHDFFSDYMEDCIRGWLATATA